MGATNELLANVILVIHLVIIAFSLYAPFSGSIGLLVLHVTWSATLLLHWVSNSDACSLTLLESSLRGIETGETLMHRIISPVYCVPEKTLGKLCYILVIVLCLVSVYQLYNSQAFNDALVGLSSGKFYESVQTIFSANSKV